MEFELFAPKKVTNTMTIAASIFAKQLKIDSRNWHVQIHIDKNVLSGEAAYGKIFVVEPRTAVIFLDAKMTIRHMLRVLAHEMVHLKQLVLGQLKYVGDDTYWLGKLFPEGKSYVNRPWEIEAAQKQEILALRFEEALGVVLEDLKIAA
jgi:hypothetical protein